VRPRARRGGGFAGGGGVPGSGDRDGARGEDPDGHRAHVPMADRPGTLLRGQRRAQPLSDESSWTSLTTWPARSPPGRPGLPGPPPGLPGPYLARPVPTRSGDHGVRPLLTGAHAVDGLHLVPRGSSLPDPARSTSALEVTSICGGNSPMICIAAAPSAAVEAAQASWPRREGKEGESVGRR